MFVFAILDFTAPTINDEVILIPIAIRSGVHPSPNKNGIIGNIPPSKNDPNILNALFNGWPAISKFKFSSSVNIVLSQTFLSDVILFTIISRSFPTNPFSL